MGAGEVTPDVHEEGCRCMVCVCRRWLNFHADELTSEVIKIATYGGSGSGTGEPDRAYDRLVREVDMERALGSVSDPFLRLVGGLHRNLQPERPEPGKALWRGPVELMRWLERFRRQEWAAACLVDDPGGWETQWELFHVNGSATLRRLLDECAVEMARFLGAAVEGSVRTTPRRRAMPVPWEESA